MNARDLLAAATPRPWERGTGSRLTIWANDHCLFEDTFQYAKLSDADLIVAAANEYEPHLDLEHAVDVGRHAFEMLRHHRGNDTATLAWVETFLSEGAGIFAARDRVDAARRGA